MTRVVDVRLRIDPFYASEEWASLRERVRTRDKWVCAYCGGKGLQVDHVKPRKRGGSDSLRNLVCCCWECNRIAGGRVFKNKMAKRKWIRMQRRIADRRKGKNLLGYDKKKKGTRSSDPGG